MTLLGDLFALQEIDSAIDQRDAVLAEIRARADESVDLAAARSDLADQSSGLGELEAQQRDLDLQVAALKDRAEPVERKLYDGSVTNSKELTDLQRDLEQITRQRQTVEETLLGVMERLEARRTATRAGESRVRTLESAWTAESDQARTDAQRLESELADLRLRRDAQAARIPAATVDTYNRLRKRRKGIAVVRVERGTCLGCRLTIPTVVIQRARSSSTTTPAQCPSCERMLYVL